MDKPIIAIIQYLTFWSLLAMAKKTITRADLYEAVHQKVGLSRSESATLVEKVLKEITDCLERGESADRAQVIGWRDKRMARHRSGVDVHRNFATEASQR